MLQQGWYGCYDCTNYAAERDPDQRTDYRYILYKVYSRYRRHKAAQIKSAFEPQVKLVRREHDAHCAARKQKRDYYLYQVRKVRPAQKGSYQKVVYCLARLTCRDQYQCDCSGKTYAYGGRGAQHIVLRSYAHVLEIRNFADVYSRCHFIQQRHLQSPRKASSLLPTYRSPVHLL